MGRGDQEKVMCQPASYHVEPGAITPRGQTLGVRRAPAVKLMFAYNVQKITFIDPPASHPATFPPRTWPSRGWKMFSRRCSFFPFPPENLLARLVPSYTLRRSDNDYP
jgi:hypothetical protein